MGRRISSLGISNYHRNEFRLFLGFFCHRSRACQSCLRRFTHHAAKILQKTSIEQNAKTIQRSSFSPPFYGLFSIIAKFIVPSRTLIGTNAPALDVLADAGVLRKHGRTSGHPACGCCVLDRRGPGRRVAAAVSPPALNGYGAAMGAAVCVWWVGVVV